MRKQRGRRISVLTAILVFVISFVLFGCDKKTGDSASSETGEKKHNSDGYTDAYCRS